MNGDVPRLFPRLGPWTTTALTHGFAAAPGELDPSSLTEEIDHLSVEKLGPFLLRATRSRGIDVGPALESRIRADVAARVARSRRTSRTASAIIARLRAKGIPSVLIKGEGLARWYDEPSTRTWTDADILVRPTDFPTAFALLSADGWDELDVSLQPRDGFNLRCREGVNLVVGERTSVDLHHRVSPWRWSRDLTLDHLLRSGERTEGADLVSGAANLAITALQLIGDHRSPGAKLIAWRDLAELGRVLDPADTAERLNATGCAGLVGVLLRQLPEPMQPGALIRALPSEPEHGRRLRWMVATARRGRTATTHVLRLPLPNAAYFVAGTAIPSRQFLAAAVPGARHPRAAWWRRLVTGATDIASRPGTGRSCAPADRPHGDEFVVRDDDVTWAVDRDGSVVVSDASTGREFTIDRGTAPLWHALADGASRSDLATVIQEIDGADPVSAGTRALGFLVDMESRQLTART